MSAFDFPDSLVDQVKLLAKEMIKEDKALAYAQASLSATKVFFNHSRRSQEFTL